MPTSTQLAALHAVVPAAQAAQAKYGVPASVTLAQWCIESSWGASELAREAKNFFGIKAMHRNAPDTYEAFPTEEYIAGRKVLVKALFERFDTETECFDVHGWLLASAARYRPAMNMRRNPLLFCSQLQLCGYSTSPDYAASLWTQIRQENLTQYDLPTPPPADEQEIAA